MRSIYTELALHGIKNECARTDIVFLPISEVCDGTVSLEKKNSFNCCNASSPRLFLYSITLICNHLKQVTLNYFQCVLVRFNLCLALVLFSRARQLKDANKTATKISLSFILKSTIIKKI